MFWSLHKRLSDIWQSTVFLLTRFEGVIAISKSNLKFIKDAKLILQLHNDKMAALDFKNINCIQSHSYDIRNTYNTKYYLCMLEDLFIAEVRSGINLKQRALPPTKHSNKR